MGFFFNELSIHNQFLSETDFKTAVLQFCAYRKLVTNAGLRMYIHRSIFKRPALGTTFRKGLQKCFQGQQFRTLMSLLSKDGFFLPDDSLAESGDRFIYFLPEGKEQLQEKATESALAECAFRKICGENSDIISLEKSKFDWSPIRVLMLEPEGSQTEEVLITNHYCPSTLEKELHNSIPPISSWAILVERISHLPSVSLEPFTIEQLKTNPFSQNVAEGIYTRAKELSDMAIAKSREQFKELYSKYATGEKARFSDSSQTEKRNFKAALTFMVDGEQRLCPFHGKVKIQQYRIHLANRPAYQETIRIVYIGPKLTKR